MYEPPSSLSRVMQGIHPMSVTNGAVTIIRPEEGGYRVEGCFFPSWPALIEWVEKQQIDIHQGWSRVKKMAGKPEQRKKRTNNLYGLQGKRHGNGLSAS